MARPRRKLGKRRPRPVWIIACEDKVSAPAYFRELNKHFSAAVSLKFSRQTGHKSAPAQVVERAKKDLDSLTKSDYGEDQAWAVFDAEPQCGEEHKKKIDQAISDAENASVKALISNPCFEHWLRLHISDCDGGYGSSKEAINALKKEWRKVFGGEYEKGKTDLSNLITKKKVAVAAERARAQHAQRQNKRAHRCQPCATELYLLIDALMNLEKDCSQEASP